MTENEVRIQLLQEQCSGGKLKYGRICDPDELKENLRMNCIPDDMSTREVDQYDDFLDARRKLMANRLRTYYETL